MYSVILIAMLCLFWPFIKSWHYCVIFYRALCNFNSRSNLKTLREIHFIVYIYICKQLLYFHNCNWPTSSIFSIVDMYRFRDRCCGLCCSDINNEPYHAFKIKITWVEILIYTWWPIVAYCDTYASVNWAIIGWNLKLLYEPIWSTVYWTCRWNVNHNKRRKMSSAEWRLFCPGFNMWNTIIMMRSHSTFQTIFHIIAAHGNLEWPFAMFVYWNRE